MTRFNSKVSTSPNATSYEGGSVYNKSIAEEWLNFLFSSYLEDRFYETANKQTSRFIDLTKDMIDMYGAEFVAKAALFARDELGMRSVSQLTAAMLNNYQFENKRQFFANYPHRADDPAEVMAAIDCLDSKRSHALVRGFGDFISNLSPYALGKYKLNSHKYNMYDVINITHAHSDAIDAYKNNVLETPDTWEVAISTATSAENRDQEWMRLVEEQKLGYLALIRNLRNILAVSQVTRDWIKTWLVPQLVNKNSIRKSLVFPYQIYAAYKNMGDNLVVARALEDAFLIALKNMPHLSGDTLIILDVSGSMTSPISYRSNITIREAGAVYAVCIALQSNSDIVKFGTYAKHFKFNKNGNLFDQIAQLDSEDGLGYGTNLTAAYRCIDRKYDRIMLISDMQIMDGRDWYYRDSAIDSYENYCKHFGRTPIYSFDLGNYHTQTSNPNNPDVYLCTSLSEKTLKFISLLEDGENIVDYINSNYSYCKRH